jgi:hypothetical protein
LRIEVRSGKGVAEPIPCTRRPAAGMVDTEIMMAPGEARGLKHTVIGDGSAWNLSD